MPTPEASSSKSMNNAAASPVKKKSIYRCIYDRDPTGEITEISEIETIEDDTLENTYTIKAYNSFMLIKEVQGLQKTLIDYEVTGINQYVLDKVDIKVFKKNDYSMICTYRNGNDRKIYILSNNKTSLEQYVAELKEILDSYSNTITKNQQSNGVNPSHIRHTSQGGRYNRRKTLPKRRKSKSTRSK